jgi:hypothetical protein
MVLSCLCWCLPPVCSLAGDILSIVQAVVVHVKHVSIDVSRQQGSSSFGRLAIHRVTTLAAIPLQFLVISREADLASACACSYRLFGAASSGAPKLGRHGGYEATKKGAMVSCDGSTPAGQYRVIANS